MPTNLLILPLLGGFLLVHLFHFSRFRSQQLEGYRLLFWSAVSGAVLLALARLCTYSLVAVGLFKLSWVLRFHAFFPVDFSGTGVSALGLGVILPLVGNLCLERDRAQDLAVRRYGGSLSRLLHAATIRDFPVSVTLENRKTYVGFVIGAPNLDPSDQYVQILPLVSGYRDKDDLRLRFTDNYSEVYQSGRVDPSDFIVVLRVENIRMASFYDPNIPTAAFEMEQPLPRPSTSAGDGPPSD
jgi:hypothetical protein